mgnify:CR=1 FL=1
MSFDKIYNFIYGTTLRRTIVRGLEIFLISGAIGFLDWSTALVPAIWVGVIEAVLKALREFRDRKVEK